MAVGRTIAAPLLFINLLMYLLVVGFASWCLNRFINGQTNHPSKLSLSLSLSL
jgi:flagellar biogenesis protein FliO